ncbi:hypothetical protein NPIL_301221 [Nephila pilipes]|uniref:Uncharacterized protein n=1 Tax=Nephila pilipes TaxID=299642 RepID=A0A8X6TQJ5_NEPPI|nr:hypothetical protein NPIL_301221 [Nephila pilipes]
MQNISLLVYLYSNEYSLPSVYVLKIFTSIPSFQTRLTPKYSLQSIKFLCTSSESRADPSVCGFDRAINPALGASAAEIHDFIYFLSVSRVE